MNSTAIAILGSNFFSAKAISALAVTIISTLLTLGLVLLLLRADKSVR